MYKNLLFVFFFALTAEGIAQALTNSPYSRFGIGDLFEANAIRNQSMGGLNIGSSHSGNINRLNPASYRRLSMTTLEFSGFTEFLEMKTSTSENRQNASGVNQFAFAFPTNFKASFAFGLSPYSALGYRFQNNYPITIDTLGGGSFTSEYTVAYSGSGGLNNFFGGAALTLAKGLDIGLNASFIFGSNNYAWNVSFPELQGFKSAHYQRRIYQQGYNLTAGLQYTDTLSLKQDRKIVFKSGFTYDHGAVLNTDKHITGININPNNLALDTVSPVVESRTRIPARLGIGIELEKYLVPGAPLDKTSYWSWGMDVSRQDWSDFNFLGINPGFRSSLRLVSGGEYIPRIISKIYLFKMAYRLGAYAEQTHLVVNNVPLNSMGITWGFGFPIPRTASKVNLGFEIGRRGTQNQNLISETYYRIRLGLTLNERWFMKFRQD